MARGLGLPRQSAPQESDANPFGLGDNLFGALFTLGLGATADSRRPRWRRVARRLGTTLGSLGTLGRHGGQVGGMIGGATGQDWLAQAGEVPGRR